MDPNTPANVAAVLGSNANIDANINQCIKVINNIGSDTYVNICTGADPVVVPWGHATWAGPVLLAAVVIGFVVFIVALNRRW